MGKNVDYCRKDAVRVGRARIRLITWMRGLILASMTVQLVINEIKGAFGL